MANYWGYPQNWGEAAQVNQAGNEVDLQGIPGSCPQLPGTILRIFIPPGAVINLANLIEVSSPGGICLIVRIPLLGTTANGLDLNSIIEAVKQAGGTVEVQQ